MQPSYDTASCTLEPDPDFSGGSITTSVTDCGGNIANFNTATKTWSCIWDVNSKSNWLTTDGFKIVVDTSLAPDSTTLYSVLTIWKLWCACSGSTYTYYTSTSASFSF